MFRWTPFDGRLAMRTLGIAFVGLGVLLLIAWITDEQSGGVGWNVLTTGGRSIGVLPLSPIAVAIGCVIALAPSSAAGELQALQALGASALRVRVGALLVAALIGTAASMPMWIGVYDVRPMFPVLAPTSDWVFDREDDAFVCARRALRVDASGKLTRVGDQLPTVKPAPLPKYASQAAAMAVIVSSVALALWVTSPERRRPLRTVIVGAVYVVATIGAFQGVGAGTLYAWVTSVPSLLLLLFAGAEFHWAKRLRRETPLL